MAEELFFQNPPLPLLPVDEDDDMIVVVILLWYDDNSAFSNFF
jgi:hypothetical protein